MWATVPVSQLAPLDYRYALDAAMTLLPAPPYLVRCDQPELAAELAQRMPSAPVTTARAALWVEPQRLNWPTVLGDIVATLSPGAPLLIIASQPLARLLPERRAWCGAPLGTQYGGIAQLRRSLGAFGMGGAEVYGIHSLRAILLNSIGHQWARLGRPDLADRCEFAARLHYGVQGRAALLATVALLFTRKGQRV